MPDRKGNLLPVDLSYGTFDVRDLTPANDGLLTSSVALDTTMGYNATQSCVECCGFVGDSTTFNPYPADVVVDGIDQSAIDAVSGCSDDTSDISSYFTTWGSFNPGIAAVTARQVRGVAAGTTTGTAMGTIPTPGACVCTFYGATPQVPVTVSAIPVNFKLVSASDDGDGVEVLLDAFFSWQSSSGSLSDLSACSMREYTTYSNTNNVTCTVNGVQQQCYFPPSPPWPPSSQSGSGYPNPTSPTPGPATGGSSEDQNTITDLNFVKPYSASSFAATQYVQYSCSNSAWTNLYGPVTITRSMSQNSSGKWAVAASRSDTSVTSTYIIPNQ